MITKQVRTEGNEYLVTVAEWKSLLSNNEVFTEKRLDTVMKWELLEKLAIGNVEDRVLHLLLKLSEQFGTENDCFVKIDFPLTHQEIANMIGVTRESVTTILKDLSPKGIIRTGRMQISVHS
ncbi:Crp/Fnr family transcriptional regulator [Paenibacillus aestuarii]|uniref:Crp/Fnr family transcriptional regulator n=1 Tax=Paenibacillus aestuarii TaxID=516965 RepID=A0ABW0KH98_9BACL